MINGVLYVLAGGWQVYYVATLPCDVFCALVCSVHMDQNAEDISTIKLTGLIRDPNGVAVLQEDFTVAAGTTTRGANAAISLRFAITAIGAWSVEIYEADTELGWVPFEVRRSD